MMTKKPTSSLSSWQELIVYCSFATVVSATNIGVTMLVLF